MNGLVVNSGYSSVDVNNPDSTVTTTLDLRGLSGTGGITRNAGGFVDFDPPATGIILTDAQNDASGILGSWATVNGGSAFAMVNNLQQIVAYTPASSSDVIATGGDVVPNDGNNVEIGKLGTANPDTLQDPTTNVNTLSMTYSGANSTVDTTGGTLRVGATGGVFIMSGANSLTIGTTPNAGVLTAGGNTSNVAGELLLENNSTSQTLTINSTITDNGTGVVSVEVAGAGTTVLAGTNTYSGSTTIASGTLQAGATNTIPTTSAVLVDVSGTLNLNTYSQSVGSIADGPNGGGTISLTSATLTTGNDSTSTTFSGVIQDGTGGKQYLYREHQHQRRYDRH
jgi:autotransporter-associated beta strand protein